MSFLRATVMLPSVFLLAVMGACSGTPINVTPPSPAATRDEHEDRLGSAYGELSRSWIDTSSSGCVRLNMNRYSISCLYYRCLEMDWVQGPSKTVWVTNLDGQRIPTTQEGTKEYKCVRRAHELSTSWSINFRDITSVEQRSDNLIIHSDTRGNKRTIDFVKNRIRPERAGIAGRNLVRYVAIVQQGPPPPLLRPASPPPLPILTVNHGSGDGSYAKGTSVTIVADDPPTGKIFKIWAGNTSIVTDPSQAATTLKMPNKNTTVTAVYTTVNAISPPHQLNVYDGRRMALVLGMGDYQHMNNLNNSINDARSIAKALQKRGFDVREGYDLPLAEMEKTIDDFVLSVRREDVVVVFDASHGFSIEGENFIIPVDFSAKNQAEGRATAVSVDQMSTKLGGRRGPTIIIIDACRGDDLSRGWPGAPRRASGEVISRSFSAPAKVLTNVYFALSTSPGLFASDGNPGQHSPFAQAFLDALEQPNLRLDEVFTYVRVQVIKSTGHAQVPFSNHSLTTDFVFTKRQVPAATVLK